MISTTFDHVVVTVFDLEQAIADFSGEGFEVVRGGAHGSTEMAMVLFADGTYVELISMRSPMLRRILRLAGRAGLLRRLLEKKSDVYQRLTSWFGRSPGPVDWCVRVVSLDETLAHWKNIGIPCLESSAFQRTRPNGQTARWRLGAAFDNTLPFVIEDSTDVRIRVPDDLVPSHPNRVLGIRCLHVSVEDPKNLTTQFEKAFSWVATDKQADFEFGPTRVQLHQLNSDDVPLKLELSCNGPDRDLNIANMQIRLVGV